MGFPFRDLREWMNYLGEQGDLVKNQTEVDIRGEIAAISRKIARTGGPAILHENVTGYPGWRILSDTLATRRRLLWALDLPAKDTTKVVAERIVKGPAIEPRVVDTGPCKEIKLFGEDIDLLKIPMVFTGERETLPYITAGMSFVKDPETGWTNIGIRRFQLVGKDKLCDLVLPYQHEGVIFSKYLKQNKPMPIAVVLGADPVALLCSTFPAPDQVDEISYWSKLTGQAIDVVKCETNDMLLPATAEIVIEGEIAPDVRTLEGPFAEFPGYYSGYRLCPVIKVKAITMRQDPIYRYMFMSLPPSEGHHVGDFVCEIELYRQLKSLIPEVSDVAVLSTRTMTTAIAVDKKARLRAPGLQRKVGLAVRAVKAGFMSKNVFIVDDDVDVHNMQDLMWCFSVKFQAARDVIVIEDVPGTYLDPSEMWVGHGGKYSGHTSYAFYDCTEKAAPYDEGYKRGLATPPQEFVDRVEENWQEYGFS